MKTFLEWLKESVFPERPDPVFNPNENPVMIKVERWSKYVNDEKDLDGGDIFFFDNWEDALAWMKRDYYENSGGVDMDLTQRVRFNMEHGIRYKAFEEKGNAEAHNEFGY